MRFCFLIAGLVLAAGSAALPGQTPTDKPYYAAGNSLGIIGAYSWDSSHMLLGYAENRKLVNIGVAYNRSLVLNQVVNWQYSGELLPVALESDPLTREVITQTAPVPASLTESGLSPVVTCAAQTAYYSFQDTATGTTYSGTATVSCSGRQWTIGEAMSPVGFQWNFLPHRKMQPLLDGHGGYMYSTRVIPVDTAGSFNFTFDFGAGFEVYRSKTRSVRAEYRYHHISNHGTAFQNPGIDSGLLQITYSFRLGH